MSAIKNYLYMAIGVVILILLGYLYYLQNSLEKTRNDLVLANKSIESLNRYIDKTNQQLKTIQQLDKDYQEKLTHAQTENDKLRDSIANGTKRLYVKTHCPMSANTATTGGTNATAAGLAEDVRPYYLRLRLEIVQTREQILGLQSYIKQVCLK